MEKTPTPTKRAIALAKKRAVSDSLNELVLCPKCQRGDIWQEAINRAEYVYSCDDLVRGQEVIDYILAEVSVMLEQAENRGIDGKSPSMT